MKQKILFISMATMGGCQRVTVNYAKLLHKNGYHCEFLLWINSHNDNNILEKFIPASIKIDYIDCRLRELPITLYKYIRSKGGYDVVFTSWTILNISICIAKIIPCSGIKYLVIRDDNMPSRHEKKIQKGLRLLGCFADIFIAQTEEMKREMADIYHIEKNVIVIHNPLDKDLLDRYSEHEVSSNELLKGSPIFIASGRISKQKDYITMLNAFAEVLKFLPNSSLYIMGEQEKNSSYYHEVQEAIKGLNIQDNVYLLGFQSNPYIYIKQVDAFVLSSIYEGLPNVLIEALYLGKPVATTTCIPYIDRVIINGKNGYKAQVGDPTDLSHAMLKAVKLKKKDRGTDVNNSDIVILTQFRELLLS